MAARLQAPKPDPRVEQTTARGLCLASRHETNPRRTPIHGHDFKRWRKSLDLSQKAAAARLGLKRRVVQYYEKGERDGKEIDIPKYVRLACFAVVKGAEDYEGPEDTSAEKPKRKRKAKGKANSQAKERKAKHKGTPAAPKPARDKAKPRAAAAPMKKEKPRAGKERR